jgi:hypothetical protein
MISVTCCLRSMRSKNSPLTSLFSPRVTTLTPRLFQGVAFWKGKKYFRVRCRCTNTCLNHGPPGVCGEQKDITLPIKHLSQIWGAPGLLVQLHEENSGGNRIENWYKVPVNIVDLANHAFTTFVKWFLRRSPNGEIVPSEDILITIELPNLVAFY